MKIDIPVFQGLDLTIADEPNERMAYPTTRLPKGISMVYLGQDLAEEGLGFGVPILMRGVQTVFPGNIELHLLQREPAWSIAAVYKMNLVERIVQRGSASLKNEVLYTIKDFLGASIRRFPATRASLTAISSGLRRLFGLETSFEVAEASGEVEVRYRFNQPGECLQVDVSIASLTRNGITELIVMNEQGAHSFDQYRDSSGISLAGKEIGIWDEVGAQEASFASPTRKVSFALPRVAGGRLFRGRELIGSRLAWAGFGYSLPPAAGGFNYEVRFRQIP